MAECIEFENGITAYFSGSTALTMDMQLWGGHVSAGAPTPLDLAREIQALNLPVTVLNPELKKAYTLSP